MDFKITNNTYQTGRENIKIVPVKLGFFAIQNEVNQNFIIPLKAQNYEITFGNQPEISVGMVFATYLKRNDFLMNGDIEYMEQLVTNYKRIKSKIYSNRLLIVFKDFFFNIWLPNYGTKYYSNVEKLIKVIEKGDSLAS